MKMSSFIRLNLSLILLLISFNKILNESCTSIDTSGLSLEEKKLKCFPYSHTDGNNGRCCADDGNKCILELDENAANDKCPQKTNVPNNCGMAGIYQPLSSTYCKEISLVQGYCCYVLLKDGKGSACVRTKKLNKEKNEATDQITKYVGNDFQIDKVECQGSNTKYYWPLIIGIIMLI